MRIIAGKYKGLQIPQPKGGTIRPTTDRAKESLFNILEHQFDLTEMKVLDLFCGSGNISIEFLSRGCSSVNAVEKHHAVISHLKKFVAERDIGGITFHKQDVFQFLKRCETQFDLIFADPPYHLPQLQELPSIIQEKKLLTANGILIVEHASQLNWNDKNCYESRQYGQSVFSFFSF